MRNIKKYTTETTKFPRSIMVWGAIRSDGKRVIFRCTNNVDSKQYQDILKCQLPKIFQQDGASIQHQQNIFKTRSHQMSRELATSKVSFGKLQKSRGIKFQMKQ